MLVCEMKRPPRLSCRGDQKPEAALFRKEGRTLNCTRHRIRPGVMTGPDGEALAVSFIAHPPFEWKSFMQNLDHKAIVDSLKEELEGLDAEREAFLARIDARRISLQRMIKEHTVYIDLWSGSGSFIVNKPQEEKEQPKVELNVVSPPYIPADAFKGLSFIDATLKYLRMVQTGKTTRELGEAFIRGGRKPNKDYKLYLDGIRTALRRRGMKNGIIRIDEKWWLTEFVPSAPRKVSISDLFSSVEEVPEEDVTEENPSNSKTHKILRAIHQNGGSGATAAEIYENIINAGHEFDKSDVYRIVSKQVNRGRVKKIGFKAFLTEKGLEAIGQESNLAASDISSLY